MEMSRWLEWAGRASAASLLAGIILTGYMGMWVFGATYAEMRNDRDEWKKLALKATHVAQFHGPRPVGMAPLGQSSHIDEVKARVQALEEKAKP